MTSNYTQADITYGLLLNQILKFNNKVETRNHSCFCHPFLDVVHFHSLPLITFRKTAWKLALTEMEWFMSGDWTCPEKLSKWWAGQLNPKGKYDRGYPEQFRLSSAYVDDYPHYDEFDQIAYILDGLKSHPHSRRLAMTSWNTGEMANITGINDNPNTPSTCHGSFIQFFVVDGALHIKHLQRSADLLLGVSHNLVQYWALLNYFAFHTGLEVGSLSWVFGDAHIYNEESHIQAANEIIGWTSLNRFSGMLSLSNSYSLEIPPPIELKLIYNYSGELDRFGTPQFLASDFTIEGEIPKPLVLVKPKLL